MLMKLILFFVTLALTIYLYPQEKYSMEEAEKILKLIKQSYAPDKRTAVFDINFELENGVLKLQGETNLENAKRELNDQLIKAGYKVKDEIVLLPDKELGDKIFGAVNLSVANIRAKPEHSSELVTQALLGTPVKVFKKNRGWYLIQTNDDYLGWVDDDGIELMDKSSLEEWNKAGKVIYTGIFGMSYSEKDKNSIPVSDVVAGNIFTWLTEKDNFVQVKYPDGRIAYLSANEAQDYNSWLASLDITAGNITKTAKSLMGLPYLWGGTSVKGVDCSGYTKTVFFLNGILLLRDASQQVNVGELIDTKDGFDNLQPGDLLFFGSKATEEKPERIIHVGIYLGNLEFIHSSGRVKINSLDPSKENFSEYRFNTFVKAKRILSSIGKNGVKLIQSE